MNKLDEIHFNDNSILIPSDIDADEEEFKVYFVRKGSVIPRSDIFSYIFADQSMIHWIKLHDFDPEDTEELNRIIEDYEADPEEYLKGSFEIVKRYH